MQPNSNLQPTSGLNGIDFTPSTDTSGLNGINFTPQDADMASQALGHSTGLMQNLLNGMSDLGNTYGEMGTGVAKGVGSTALSMSNIGQNVAQTITAPLIGGALKPDPNAPGFQQAAQQLTTPTNTPQDIGFGGEKVGEFFAPGGAEKGLFARGAEYIDKIPEALGLAGKPATALVGALKTALGGAIGGASMGGITALQGGSPEQVQSAAELGSVGGGASGALEQFGPEISQMLNKADFKLSPAKEAKTTKIANNAAQFITDNQILGSDSTKFAKLSNITNQFESALQSSLPEQLAVPKNDIISELDKNVNLLKQTDPAIYNQARAKADEAIQLIQDTPTTDQFTKGGTMSLQDALNGKRSWGDMAFRTSAKSKQDPTISSEGAYAVEQAYQKALQDTMDRTNTQIQLPQGLQSYFGGKQQVPLQDFNKIYSNAINAKNLTGIARFKSDAGLFGRMFGLFAGRALGASVAPGLIPEILGAAAGEAASTHLPGVVRNVSERALAHPQVPMNTAKIIQGTGLNQ